MNILYLLEAFLFIVAITPIPFGETYYNKPTVLWRDGEKVSARGTKGRLTSAQLYSWVLFEPPSGSPLKRLRRVSGENSISCSLGSLYGLGSLKTLYNYFCYLRTYGIGSQLKGGEQKLLMYKVNKVPKQLKRRLRKIRMGSVAFNRFLQISRHNKGEITGYRKDSPYGHYAYESHS